MGGIGFFSGTVFLGVFLISYIVKYREEHRERVEQVNNLKKDIERLRNGEEYGSGEENWHIDTYAKEIKFYFFPNLKELHIFHWVIFWVVFAFLYGMIFRLY
tara:strand:- start:102 stop:407 length:306 start_codon:yes stop_codon:yes gene_type:complete